MLRPVQVVGLLVATALVGLAVGITWGAVERVDDRRPTPGASAPPTARITP